jgi:hypothetical protein
MNSNVQLLFPRVTFGKKLVFKKMLIVFVKVPVSADETSNGHPFHQQVFDIMFHFLFPARR